MAIFNYSGIDALGNSVQGRVEAPSDKNAYEQLSSKGVTPIKIRAGGPGTETASDLPFWKRPMGMGSVPFATRVLFMRQLGTFVSADIPLLEALGVLRKQEKSPAFARILDDLYQRVQAGETFSSAIAQHPRIFSPLLVSMIRVGETGGVMGPVLDQMAVWMEHEEEVRGEVQSALAYPVVILVLGFVTVLILITFVLPRISGIFAGMEAKLPLPTRILMGSSAIVAKWWWLIPAVIFGIFYGTKKILKTKRGRAIWDRISISAPVIGALGRQAAIGRFARACAALLQTGVPLLEALRVVRGLLGNSIMVKMIEDTIAGVTKGQSLAVMLEESPYFPPSAVHLLRVGERTGRLSEMFGKVADTFERSTRNQIKVMLNLLAPLMIVALAVVVAFIAMSILLPIFQMNKLMR